MASKKVPSKAQTTTKKKQEDLTKLGKYLSASDVRGTDRTRKRESARREADLLNKYYAGRGGGRGTATRTAPKKPGPGMNDRLAGAIDAGVRTAGAVGRAIGRAVTSSGTKPPSSKAGFASKTSYDSSSGTWNVSSRKKPSAGGGTRKR